MPMIDADGCLINVSVEAVTMARADGCRIRWAALQMWERSEGAHPGVRVIRYDRRGTANPAAARPYPWSASAATCSHLDDLQIEKVQLVGLSMAA